MLSNKRFIIAAACATPLALCTPFVTSAMGQQQTAAIDGISFEDPEAELENRYRTGAQFDPDAAPIALENEFSNACDVDNTPLRNLPPITNTRPMVREQEIENREEVAIGVIEDAATNCLEERFQQRYPSGRPRTVALGEHAQDDGFSTSMAASTDTLRGRARQRLGQVGNANIVLEGTADTDGEQAVRVRVTTAPQRRW